MKKLLVLLCIFLLSACDVPSDKLVTRYSTVYEVNSQIPFTGVATGYYENGQLKGKGNYKDGELNGLLEMYHENGQLEEKVNYKYGERHGLSKSYQENGQVKYSPVCYQNGNRVDMSKCK